jgi:hypothetical protein
MSVSFITRVPKLFLKHTPFIEGLQYEFYVNSTFSISITVSNYSACYLLQAGFLLALFFDPEDGDEMFLRNVG